MYAEKGQPPTVWSKRFSDCIKGFISLFLDLGLLLSWLRLRLFEHFGGIRLDEPASLFNSLTASTSFSGKSPDLSWASLISKMGIKTGLLLWQEFNKTLYVACNSNVGWDWRLKLQNSPLYGEFTKSRFVKLNNWKTNFPKDSFQTTLGTPTWYKF